MKVSEPLPQKCAGDSILKNRGRLGAANRYTVKQYQFPPHYFTPTKEKLEEHLKDSRVLPNAELIPKGRDMRVVKRQLFK
jgi:hypothetical protein